MTEMLVRAKYIVTNPALREKGMLTDSAMYIKGAHILEIDAFHALRQKYPEAQVIGSDNHIAVPGFIDAHNHGQGVTTIAHGTHDDQLEAWVHYWPGRSPRSAEEVHYDSLVAITRQIQSGVTTSMRHDTPSLPLEAYQTETEAITKAYELSGIRFAYALGTTDQFRLVYEDNDKFIARLPRAMQAVAQELAAPIEKLSVDECLAFVQDLHARYRHTTRINFFLGVIGPQWDSDSILTKLRDKAQALGTGMHGPLLETLYQKIYPLREFGHSAVEHFYRLGMLGRNYSAAHGVWLTEKDMDYFAASGATVIHCPSSNLRLHSGIAPVPMMQAKGVNVALGVDSEGINDNDDMLQEMRLALMLHRHPRNAYRNLDEWDVLSMATINGARAVLLEDHIGTLEVGKEADIVLVQLDRITASYLHPNVGPVAALVHHAQSRDIDVVMVAGQVIVRQGEPTQFDQRQVRAILNRIMAEVDRPAERHADALRAQLIPEIRKYYADWNVPALSPVYLMNSRS